MLRALPFQTIGDVARLGLELHVYCPACRTTRQVDAGDPAIAGRGFATARFRCAGTRPSIGTACGGRGVPKIQPRELLPVGGSVTLTFLWCPHCLWEIDQARLDQPPWSGTRQRYACPGCSRPVQWHIHGPAWRPSYAPRGASEGEPS